MHYLSSLAAVLLFTVLLAACNSQESPSANDSPEPSLATSAPASSDTLAPPPPPPAASETISTKDYVYAWVDKLNIRDKPSTSGKVVTSVNDKDKLEFTGNRSAEKSQILLRGAVYDEVWLEVTAPDGVTGWVFGGAVHLLAQEKGNEPYTATKFNLPKFGSFDLTEWTKDPKVVSGGGGDAESETTTYTKNGQTLEITETSMGDYGYSTAHRLLDENQRLQKERRLSLSRDSQPMTLTETILDYTNEQPYEYTRTQFIRLPLPWGDKPLLARGEWLSTELAPLNALEQ